MTSSNLNYREEVWLLQLSEPLPIDSGFRPMRTSDHAENLLARGYYVKWFTGRFNHQTKRVRLEERLNVPITEKYSLELLRGGRYTGNLSIKRVIHHSLAALHFLWTTLRLPPPAFLIISYPTPELAIAGMLYCKFRKIPYVVDVRDAWPTIFKSYVSGWRRLLVSILVCWYSLLYRMILSNARGIFGSSSAMLLDAKDYLGIQDQFRIKESYFIGYSDPQIQVLPVPSFFPRQSPLRVLFIGSLGFSYDIPFLLEIAHAVEELDHTSIEFVIAGDGECRKEYEQRTLELKLHNVKFLGWLTDSQIQSVLLESHVGALLIRGGTSKFTVPNKLSEYLSRGLVILSNLEGEVQSLISNYEAGLTCSQHTAKDIAEWLTRLAQDQIKIKALRQNSRKLFNEHFEKQKIYNQMIEEIIDLCSIK